MSTRRGYKCIPLFLKLFLFGKRTTSHLHVTPNYGLFSGAVASDWLGSVHLYFPL